ncbi:MAG: hypothetical protein KDD60_11625 [Bdellovibrionales bacterium]|nr:hypothetical protein [Bdellovibrionales bacterium]
MNEVCDTIYEDIRRGLTKDGVAVFKLPTTQGISGAPAEIASRFGTMCGMRNRDVSIEELIVVQEHEAKPSSLSKLHGSNSFPLHTDTAHWVMKWTQ